MISIPTIRDRVVQGALRLILEPIFEADFSRHSYGARPGRSAHEAIEKVRTGLLRKRHRVVDVDLSALLRQHPARADAAKVARRVQDDRVLGMVKQFLRSTGDKGDPARLPALPTARERGAERPRPHPGSGQRLPDLRAIPRRHGRPDVRLPKGATRGPTERSNASAREAEAIGVSLNAEKTRTVDAHRRPRSSSRSWASRFGGNRSRGPEGVSRTRVRDRRRSRSPAKGQEHAARQPAPRGAGWPSRSVNPIVRGWVNYFRVGNSSQRVRRGASTAWSARCRRFAAKKKLKRRASVGSGGVARRVRQWGLFDDYRVRTRARKRAPTRTDS